jgi:tetraprenyl-beta-curcumene synthase
MHHWRAKAEAVPDRTLRRTALESQSEKAGNLEGAVAFAVLATPRYRRRCTQAMAAFEMAFDYVDCLSEMSCADPIRNGRQLSRALSVAVTASEQHHDYYAHHLFHDDGGYLRELAQTCRDALAVLPAYHIVKGPLGRAAMRIGEYQTYNHGDANGSHDAFRHWGEDQHSSSNHCELFWWEFAAAHGSSLLTFALIAAASSVEIRPCDVRAMERAYFPWIGAANSLLDSLVDQAEDKAPGQHRLLDYYTTSDEPSERLQYIVEKATQRADALEPPYGHALIVAAMVSFYISAPELKASTTPATRQAIHQSAGNFVGSTMRVMYARRMVASLAHAAKSRGLFQL